MESKETAEHISRVFSPPLMAALTFLALLISKGASNSLLLAMISLGFGTVIPLAVLYCLVRRGIIRDMCVSERKSRVVAFAGTILSYLLGGIGLLLARAPSIVTAAMLCYLGNALVLMLISLKWKISVHASGITGPATVLSYSMGMSALVLFGLAIPVGWARTKLGAHTLAQVLAGALLAIVITWLQLEAYLMVL